MVYTAPIWNLANIESEFRGITGRPDVSMMSQSDAWNFINYYYQYVLPKELKIFWGYTYYSFYCTANIDQYVAPTNFQTLNPTVYSDGWPMVWYLDPDTFYQDYPQQDNKTVVATGDGTTNSFTFQIPAYPVLARSLYVTDGVQIAQDNGNGGFYDPNTGLSLSGTVNYPSGAVSGLSFTSPPAANTNITQTSQTYMPNRPQGILFYKTQPLTDATLAVLDAVNMFVLRPVPDQTYIIKMQGIQVPPAMVNPTDVPFRADLGPLIALGAALHVFKKFSQMDQYNQNLPDYMRFKDVCMQDTYEEYLYQRSVSTF